ncbi:hypothetical protein [Actinomadura sp. WMMB 499]|uniref:hypothetical protein n=1 Tax=Actinomadura sp. WMMB 499 TaxID=1219491 RepID=UPI001247B249|nr:hypothetical protein [Actinomadura sp. WMMB 499]QFG20993.1 hypothetical protein F7P10_07395 [Actinomadura sp. WMMB 499]
MRRRPLVEAAGIVAAPADRVWTALADELLPDGVRGGRFKVEDAPGHTSTVEVAGRTIAFQGGWWYRGEWSVEPHPDGARLVHRVFNVARATRWAVPLANRMFVGFADSTRASFAERLDRIGRRLGRPVRPSD